MMMITITMFCVVFVTYLCSSRLTRNMSPVDATSTPLQHHHSSYQDDATLMRIRIKIKMMFMKRWWMVIIKPWLRKPSSDKKKTFWTFWPELCMLRPAFGRQSPEWIVGFYFILFFSERKWCLTRAPIPKRPFIWDKWPQTCETHTPTPYIWGSEPPQFHFIWDF